jgi:regulator of replication initiation timing
MLEDVTEIKTQVKEVTEEKEELNAQVEKVMEENRRLKGSHQGEG